MRKKFCSKRHVSMAKAISRRKTLKSSSKSKRCHCDIHRKNLLTAKCGADNSKISLLYIWHGMWLKSNLNLFRAINAAFTFFIRRSVYIVIYYGFLLNIRNFGRQYLEENTIVAGKWLNRQNKQIRFISTHWFIDCCRQVFARSPARSLAYGSYWIHNRSGFTQAFST